MGNMEVTEEEKKFNKSRIMWAFINDELYWTVSEFGHEEWINSTFKDVDFDTVTRGYIRKDISKTEIVDVAAYKGDFKSVQLSDRQIHLLTWLANLNYYFNELHIYSNGVQKGEPGTVWNTLGTAFIVDHSEIAKEAEYISLYDMILYEDFLKKLTSRERELLTEHKELENEHRLVIEYIKNYRGTNDYTTTALENIAIFKRLRGI